MDGFQTRIRMPHGVQLLTKIKLQPDFFGTFLLILCSALFPLLDLLSV